MSKAHHIGDLPSLADDSSNRDAAAVGSNSTLAVSAAAPVVAAGLDTMRPIQLALGASPAHAAPLLTPTSPTMTEEVSFLNGLNPDGSVDAQSYWGVNGETAHKWGAPTAGMGATITYAFDSASNFTAQEQATFLKAAAMWESVANVQFVQANDQASANVLFHRGNDGGAYTQVNTTPGAGSLIGTPVGQALISIDTSSYGFDLSGSTDVAGGYGLSTVIHEMGHLLGLGHGGDYNGNVNEATDQFSAYDDRMWTTMSYIFWAENDAKYFSQYPVQGANWGVTDDGIYRQAPHSVMALDIMAIQQLYGAPVAETFAGGDTFGFHTTVSGPLKDIFDFRLNSSPVVTLYDQGAGNTLDVSGYAANQRLDLHDGTFSDVGGHTDNVAIAFGTEIDNAKGGSGNDRITASDHASMLNGGGGSDTLVGGAGNDRLIGSGGSDSMAGGGGNDLYFVDNSQDVVTEQAGGGHDRVISSIDYTLTANVEDLIIQGHANYGLGNELGNKIIGNNVFNILEGFDGDDKIAGKAQGDAIYGGAGDDVLNGGSGADNITGGAGQDRMIGGSGADAFIFNDGDFSGVDHGTADVIRDFDSSQGDYIDLSGVDAQVGAGNQAFHFIDTAAFSDTAGELRYEIVGNETRIYGDTNGDGVADFAIRLVGTHTLSAGDFAL